MDLENKIKSLQEITAKMEDNALSISDGVKLYEEGINLAKECYEELNKIKGQVNIIKQDLDKYREESLD